MNFCAYIMNGPQSQNRTDVMFNFLALSSIHFTCSEFKVNHQSGVKILTSGRVASHPVQTIISVFVKMTCNLFL